MRPLLLIGLIFTIFGPVSPTLPPCLERPTYQEAPLVNSEHYCLELVIDDSSAGELAFTALAVAADGSLYATRPLTGELLVLEDTNADGLPDASRRLDRHLTLPNALALVNNTLFIAGKSELYQWEQATGLKRFVDDLPAGTGFWTGGIAVNENGQIYVGKGVECDNCPPVEDRGVILRFEADGSDRHTIATGFRQPAGLTWWQNALWVTDTARDDLNSGSYDELNRITSSNGENFGFPRCFGNEVDTDDLEFDCSETIPPTFTFPTDSTPISIAPYESTTFPELTGSMLVALSGSYNDSRLRGYEVGALHFDPGGNPTAYETLLPYLTSPGLQYQGSGLFPHRPYGIAVSPEGWIYISIGGGKIYALRPV